MAMQRTLQIYTSSLNYIKLPVVGDQHGGSHDPAMRRVHLGEMAGTVFKPFSLKFIQKQAEGTIPAALAFNVEGSKHVRIFVAQTYI